MEIFGHAPSSEMMTFPDLNEIYIKHRDKIENVYQEVVSRNAYVIKISDNVGDIIVEKNQTYGGILANVYIQLLSYYCSVEKGNHPDFPRNLAKVVSVE
jgi:glucosamine--fructose-6-phosphate aminotransferase (isomerizing)